MMIDERLMMRTLMSLQSLPMHLKVLLVSIRGGFMCVCSRRGLQYPASAYRQ